MNARTLDELEGEVWGPPQFDSHLVTTCHRLRTKPVDEFTVEDLRIMISQKFSLQHLMPRAIEMLDRNPLADGDLYDGDLLMSVIEATEWLQCHPASYAKVAHVVKRAMDELDEYSQDFRPSLERFLTDHTNSKDV